MENVYIPHPSTERNLVLTDNQNVYYQKLSLQLQQDTVFFASSPNLLFSVLNSCHVPSQKWLQFSAEGSDSKIALICTASGEEKL